MSEKILWHPVDVDNELIAMGLDRPGLIDSIRHAEQERSFVTSNDAVGFGNYLLYDKAARRLREVYLPRGWIKDDTNNQAAIKNPDTKIRVVPCNFDEFAGNRLVRPTNKSPKGEVSKKKSACNRTAWLPGLPPMEPELDDGYQTWILGIHIEPGKPTGAELSWPVAFDGSYFTQFAKRILLLSGKDDAGGEKLGRDEDAVGVVDIAVNRK